MNSQVIVEQNVVGYTEFPAELSSLLGNAQTDLLQGLLAKMVPIKKSYLTVRDANHERY